MNDSLSAAERYGHFVIRWRWPILLLTLILSVGAAWGAQKLVFNNDYRVFFSDANPQLVAFEELQRTYTKTDNVLFAIEPDSGGVFQPEVLAAIEEMTLESWQLPFVLRVDSLSNYQHTIAEEDDLIVQDLYEGAEALTPEELATIREVAVNEPLLRHLLVSPDGQFSAVNVTFQMPEESMDEVPITVAAARALAEEIEAKYPVKLHLSGMVMLNNAFFESAMNDMSTLVPAMYLIILVTTLLLVRSFSATFGVFLVLLTSITTGMGLAGWLGFALTPPSSSAPTIVMTLAVADSIHILISLVAAMRAGRTKHAAIIESLRINMSPILLTSLTTAIGFLSMNFSDAPPFRDLGNITALGVVAALFYSTTLLPAFLAIVPVRIRAAEAGAGDGWIQRFGDRVIAHHTRVLAGCVIVAVILLSFIPQIQLNDDFVRYFHEKTTFRQDVDFTSAHLTGAYQLQYSLPAEGSNGISDPAFLARVEAFVTWLREQPEVVHVDSITDTFRRLNKNLHGDDPAYYRLPEARDEAAQYLLLYELSLPYGLDLNNRLNIDKSSTQIVVTLQDLTSVELREITHRGEQWLLDHHPEMAAVGIGPAIMFAYITGRNIKSMLLGTFLAVLLISAILVLALRSVRLGFLSLIPNLLPAGLAFGLWGMIVGEVNLAVSMVSGMTLGIVVDDTIHFLSKYLRARREKGLDARMAVRYAFDNVGRAILVTSVILVVGFLVLAQSTFAMNSSMAILTAIAIVMALVADFLLLPALLIVIDSKKDKTTDPIPDTILPAN